MSRKSTQIIEFWKLKVENYDTYNDWSGKGESGETRGNGYIECDTGFFMTGENTRAS